MSAGTDVEVEVRAPGRPRSRAADAAILDATVDLYADLGFEGLSVNAVASRAGVSKATIYRRFPSKVDLVLAAATRAADREHGDVDTGNVRDDLRGHVNALVRLLTKTEIGRCVPTMVADKTRNTELAAAHNRFSARRRGRVVEAVRRGRERGELRPDTDADLVADLVVGPVFYRHLVSGGRIDRAYADHLVDAVLAGFVGLR
ncbi:MAG: TetR/AcrR family transcriptional regulator [Acidimicrobiia bacterium]